MRASEYIVQGESLVCIVAYRDVVLVWSPYSTSPFLCLRRGLIRVQIVTVPRRNWGCQSKLAS